METGGGFRYELAIMLAPESRRSTSPHDATRETGSLELELGLTGLPAVFQDFPPSPTMENVADMMIPDKASEKMTALAADPRGAMDRNARRLLKVRAEYPARKHDAFRNVAYDDGFFRTPEFKTQAVEKEEEMKRQEKRVSGMALRSGTLSEWWTEYKKADAKKAVGEELTESENEILLKFEERVDAQFERNVKRKKAKTSIQEKEDATTNEMLRKINKAPFELEQYVRGFTNLLPNCNYAMFVTMTSENFFHSFGTAAVRQRFVENPALQEFFYDCVQNPNLNSDGKWLLDLNKQHKKQVTPLTQTRRLEELSHKELKCKATEVFKEALRTAGRGTTATTKGLKFKAPTASQGGGCVFFNLPEKLHKAVCLWTPREHLQFLQRQRDLATKFYVLDISEQRKMRPLITVRQTTTNAIKCVKEQIRYYKESNEHKVHAAIAERKLRALEEIMQLTFRTEKELVTFEENMRTQLLCDGEMTDTVEETAAPDEKQQIPQLSAPHEASADEPTASSHADVTEEQQPEPTEEPTDEPAEAQGEEPTEVQAEQMANGPTEAPQEKPIEPETTRDERTLILRPNTQNVARRQIEEAVKRGLITRDRSRTCRSPDEPPRHPYRQRCTCSGCLWTYDLQKDNKNPMENGMIQLTVTIPEEVSLDIHNEYTKREMRKTKKRKRAESPGKRKRKKQALQILQKRLDEIKGTEMSFKRRYGKSKKIVIAENNLPFIDMGCWVCELVAAIAVGTKLSNNNFHKKHQQGIIHAKKMRAMGIPEEFQHMSAMIHF